MLLAKIALGLGGTALLAGAYVFHEGIVRVDADDSHDASHVHVWVPAALVPLAIRVIPSRHFDHALSNAGPWLPTLRVLTKELRRFPEAELVEVRDGRDQVHVRTHQGKLLIDVSEPGQTVHVSCPLAMMQDVAGALESKVPGA
ncbi:MAG TPA: hypothetical protein VFR42_11355 [Candidatus Acidoferrum sp.]|nr:hypothetical protein [Candidatus Acidoferrum sp.]